MVRAFHATFNNLSVIPYVVDDDDRTHHPIYNTREDHVNHYSNKAVDYLWKEIQTYAKREAMKLLRNYFAAYADNILVLINSVWCWPSLQLMNKKQQK